MALYYLSCLSCLLAEGGKKGGIRVYAFVGKTQHSDVLMWMHARRVSVVCVQIHPVSATSHGARLTGAHYFPAQYGAKLLYIYSVSRARWQRS